MSNNNIIGRIFVALAMCLACAAVCRADAFKGRIVNAETGEVIAGASVRSEVNPQPGWSIHGAATTDSTGCFVLNSGWEGRIMFTFSMIGYRNQRKVDYSYGSEVKDTTDLGTIRLQPTALMLQEVEVKASVPRITMSGDTIVFNPEAFKLKEGARLDELIKKLPGVENRDGKLYWNNKPIRLMMNGKNVFGGDQIVGQLPAEVAKKLKLYDRKSELARHTGNDDGTEDQVLDIQVKPGFLDKWYGDAEAQYQTQKRYMFDIEASRLSDHDPQMIYAQANNRNRKINRTMRQSMDMNIAGDGKSQYGSYNYQHNWQTKGTDAYDNNRFDIGASLGHSDGQDASRQSTETFFPGSDRTFAQNAASSYRHELAPQLLANLFAYTDSVNTITVNAKATYTRTRTASSTYEALYGYRPEEFAYHTLDALRAAQPGDDLYSRIITRGSTQQTAEQQRRKLTVDYSWQHFFGKKGSFTLQGNTTAGGSDDDTHYTRSLEYIRDGRAEKLWQSYDYRKHDISTMLGAAADYWLGSKVYLSLADNVSYSRVRADRLYYRDTGERLAAGGKPTTPDADNTMHNLTHTWTNRLTFKSTISPVKALMIMPKFDWTASRENTDYRYGRLDTAAVRTSHTYAPSLFVKLKMGRVRSMDLSFAYTSTVPELTQTFGYRNTADPLAIATGNPLLGNTYGHTTSYSYHRMWLRKQIVLGVRASYHKDINPVATLYRYNSATGAYTTMPMNVRGGDSWTIAADYDQGLGVYFRLMNKLSVSASQSYGFLTIVDSDDETPMLNHQRLLGVKENFELSYEAEKVRLRLFDRLDYSRYRYDDNTYNSHPLYNSVGISATLKLSPVEIMVRLSDEFRTGYQTADMNGHRLMAMAYATYSFCKNKCRLTLEADDIFNKDIYYGSQYSAYQRKEYSEDYIHHYVNLTFAYRFDAKAKKK